ncbi:unnamed protein product [Onchocerca flexuosa]|uniref:4HBT domain-containing protein n=1 Tax=Onchocerca flexuosa TaxID=387005 RepID=A0A183I6G0_9BILA|nr:unnamed protein product [Onchocerca flexuosa]
MANRYFQVVVKAFKSLDKFSGFVHSCRLISATKGTVEIELDVTKEHLNSSEYLHEGCIASLVDMVTSVAIGTIVHETNYINYRYPNCAKLGDTIIINGQVWYSNNKLAYTRAEIRRKKDNLLIAYGQHTKVFPKKPK